MMIWASSWLIAVVVPWWCSARVNSVSYGYTYDNTGNRDFAVEGEDTAIYTANALNQYTRITENAESVFIPEFDADGNQTRIKTETGIWGAVYNSENRPVTFSNADSGIVVESAYDSMGRRTYKRVTLDRILDF
jgi:YD repeat-containing protein